MPDKSTQALPKNLVQIDKWEIRTFQALSVDMLYALLRLRSAVFVVEQQCIFQDMDGLDASALHVLGWSSTQLVATARCMPAGSSEFTEASIGRVATSPLVRGSGAGHELVRRAVAALQGQWGIQPIRIGAQAHLENFYQQHGFVKDGAPYLEDGILHIEMLRP